VLTPVPPGATDVALLRVEVETRGYLDTLYMNQMIFHDKGMLGYSGAKLYYTGNSATFSTNNLIGSLPTATNSL